MKKNLLAFIFIGVLVLGVFAVPSDIALAHEGDDCGCPEIVDINGAERNKQVADFISSDVFKDIKKVLWRNNYSWDGSKSVSVQDVDYGGIMKMVGVGVPFSAPDGTVYVYLFGIMNGEPQFLEKAVKVENDGTESGYSVSIDYESNEIIYTLPEDHK